MTAATVALRVENSDPTSEVVVLTVSDGETYVSRKFASIQAAIACANTDNDAEINITFSGGTATINWASVTDGTATIVLWGRK